MSELDAIVQRVVVEGTGEIGATLQELAHVGSAAFHALEEAANGANGAFSLMSGGTLAIIGAVIAATAAIVKLADSTAEGIIAVNALGESMGITAGSAQALEHAFATVGISSEQFARMMQRASQRIGQQWNHIQEEMETGATKIKSSQLAVAESHLAVEEAMNKAGFAAAEWRDKLVGDAQAVSDAYRAVARDAADANSQTANTALSIRGAKIALEEAQAKNAEANGGIREPGYTKQQREKDKLQLAEDQAKQRLADLQMKSDREAEDQRAKAEKDKLSLSRAKLKEQEDQAERPLSMQKSDLGVDKAKNAETSAIQSMHKTLHDDLGHVVSALERGDYKKALEADPQKFVKALTYEASQHFAQGGKPTSDNLLEELINETREMKGAGIKQSELIDKITAVFGGRGSQASRFLAKVYDPNFDYQKTKEEGKGAISDGMISKATGLEETKAKIEAAMTNWIQQTLFGTKTDMLPQTPKSQLQPEQDRVEHLGRATGQDGDQGTKKLDDSAQKAGGALEFFAKVVVEAVSSIMAEGSGKLKPDGMADGGYISGAGSATSDSVPARLSNGEFVVRAAAVRAYGRDFMESINSASAQGFAFGGFAGNFSAPRASGDLGSRAAAGNPVNLHIDGNTFKMNAPADVAAKLTHFAISRQMAETGRKPSWVR